MYVTYNGRRYHCGPLSAEEVANRNIAAGRIYWDHLDNARSECGESVRIYRSESGQMYWGADLPYRQYTTFGRLEMYETITRPVEQDKYN